MKVDYTELVPGDMVTMVLREERVTLEFYDLTTFECNRYLRGAHRAGTRTPEDFTCYRHDKVAFEDVREGDLVLLVLNDDSRHEFTVIYTGTTHVGFAYNLFSRSRISDLYLLDRKVPKLTDYVTASTAALIEDHFTVVPK